MTTFQELHHAATPLVLPNAWDVGSAQAFVAAGFPAVGTTSSGIAASNGMPDGDRSIQAATLALMAQVGRLPVHVTADIEDGFADDPVEVAGLVAEFAALGVVGLNIEDSRSGHLVDPLAVASKSAAIKRRTPDVFVNARVDNLWLGEQPTVDAVLQRAHAYAAAGADGIFVPGVATAEDIRGMAAVIELPLNVLAHPLTDGFRAGEIGRSAREFRIPAIPCSSGCCRGRRQRHAREPAGSARNLILGHAVAPHRAPSKSNGLNIGSR